MLNLCSKDSRYFKERNKYTSEIWSHSLCPSIMAELQPCGGGPAVMESLRIGQWFPPSSASMHKEMREEFSETSAGEMYLYLRSIHWMATYHLLTRHILHSSCNIKGAKWFLFLCCQRSDLTVTVQAAVQLINQVHLQLCETCVIRNMCLATFPWTPWSCLATRIPENWAWHRMPWKRHLGMGAVWSVFPHISQNPLFFTSISCSHSVPILAVWLQTVWYSDYLSFSLCLAPGTKESPFPVNLWWYCIKHAYS